MGHDFHPISLLWNLKSILNLGFHDIQLHAFPTSNPDYSPEHHGRVSGYLAGINTRVSLLHVHHLQPPVVGVDEGGLDPCVPGVGGLAHGKKVWKA